MFFLLLVLALAAAWYLGRRSSAGRNRGGGRDLTRDYFIGLNYLLNDEPDDAIDTFIHALEINSNTLETHMALGTLLRRRGKVDKSIVVYQGVLARPRLSENEVNRVKVELIRSYIAAGLLDRAERLLEELQHAKAEIKQAALALAINLYQLEKEWSKAVAAADELLKICPAKERQRYQMMAAHFYCEMALQEIELRQYSNARQLLKKAFQHHRGNVRASLLLGKVENSQEHYRDAIKALTKVKQQDPDFVSETFIPLLDSYHRLGSQKQLEKFIQNSLDGQTTASMILGISDYLQRESGNSEALTFLLKHLREKPSLRIMDKALAIMGTDDSSPQLDNLRLFHHIMDEYINTKPLYQCGNCGFEARSLHWLCPSCSEWGVIKPIKGLLGE